MLLAESAQLLPTVPGSACHDTDYAPCLQGSQSYDFNFQELPRDDSIDDSNGEVVALGPLCINRGS